MTYLPSVEMYCSVRLALLKVELLESFIKFFNLVKEIFLFHTSCKGLEGKVIHFIFILYCCYATLPCRLTNKLNFIDISLSNSYSNRVTLIIIIVKNLCISLTQMFYYHVILYEIFIFKAIFSESLNV